MQAQDFHTVIVVKALSLAGDLPDLIVVPYRHDQDKPRGLVSSRQSVNGEACRVLTGDIDYLLSHPQDWLVTNGDEVVLVLHDKAQDYQELQNLLESNKGSVRVVHGDAFV